MRANAHVRRRYLNDSEVKPRVLLRDYSPPSLASLLASLAALDFPPGNALLSALAHHALAAGAQRASPQTALRIAAATAKLGCR